MQSLRVNDGNKPVIMYLALGKKGSVGEKEVLKIIGVWKESDEERERG